MRLLRSLRGHGILAGRQPAGRRGSDQRLALTRGERVCAQPGIVVRPPVHVAAVAAEEVAEPARGGEGAVDRVGLTDLRARGREQHVEAHAVEHAQPLEEGAQGGHGARTDGHLARSRPQQQVRARHLFQEGDERAGVNLRVADGGGEDEQLAVQLVLSARVRHLQRIGLGVGLLRPEDAEAPPERECGLRAYAPTQRHELVEGHRALSSGVRPGQHVSVEPDALPVGVQLRPPLRQHLQARLDGRHVLEVELQVARAVRDGAVEELLEREVA
eukprot:scaffold55745_cov66-Phaeocystis_antarctica.AAC.7